MLSAISHCAVKSEGLVVMVGTAPELSVAFGAKKPTLDGELYLLNEMGATGQPDSTGLSTSVTQRNHIAIYSQMMHNYN